MTLLSEVERDWILNIEYAFVELLLSGVHEIGSMYESDWYMDERG